MLPPDSASNTHLIADATYAFVWHGQMAAIPANDWQALVGSQPLLDYHCLRAFEASGAVSEDTGWIASHLTAWQGKQLMAAVPCYFKMHSYGEYVFDWSWADAYTQAGGDYYPKLISAIPFSPVTGPRLLIHPAVSEPHALAAQLLAQMQALCEKYGLSGAHVLFPDPWSADQCDTAGWLRRQGVQFRWHNPGYADWDSFMAALSRDKRKKIRQERQKVAQTGVQCRHVDGHSLRAEELDLFYACYSRTYALHGSTPYLPKAFFQQLSQALPAQFCLFIASLDGEDIAASLCLRGADTLYGRYWGSLRDISCLHFELCYYQPQQFCITADIAYFEGGAQGVHKLARGFLPYPTCSYHWLQDPGFRHSVQRFLARETHQMDLYVHELEERSPFKAAPDDASNPTADAMPTQNRPDATA